MQGGISREFHREIYGIDSSIMRAAPQLLPYGTAVASSDCPWRGREHALIDSELNAPREAGEVRLARPSELLSVI
jgi:hypothetical protein